MHLTLKGVVKRLHLVFDFRQHICYFAHSSQLIIKGSFKITGAYIPEKLELLLVFGSARLTLSIAVERCTI